MAIIMKEERKQKGSTMNWMDPRTTTPQNNQSYLIIFIDAYTQDPAIGIGVYKTNRSKEGFYSLSAGQRLKGISLARGKQSVSIAQCIMPALYAEIGEVPVPEELFKSEHCSGCHCGK